MNNLINTAVALLTLLYPLGVYYGIRYFEPWIIACLLVSLLLIRLIINTPSKPQLASPLLLVGIAYCGFAIWSNELLTLRLYPVIINAAMLLIFMASLFSPQSIIERLARIQHPDLPPKGVGYTRRVTQVWCGFFLLNGGVALITALWGSFEIWSLYNGLIAYLLMGILFAGEYLVRIRTQRHVK